MQDWLRTFHGQNQPFPAPEIALKVAITFALGLLVGFEREWSNKDIGARTFAMAALLGLLGSFLGPIALLIGGLAVLLLIAFTNIRGISLVLPGSWRRQRHWPSRSSSSLAFWWARGTSLPRWHVPSWLRCCSLSSRSFAPFLAD
jgi:hypothetical protein